MFGAIEKLTAERERLSECVRSVSTRTSYARHWKLFVEWCTKMGRSPLPASADTVVFYVTDILSVCKITTARSYISAINHIHRTSGHPRPAELELRRLLDGAERLRREQPRQMKPIRVEHLRLMCAKASARDRALLTIGFGSALRRSNLVALDLADVSITEQGLLIYVRKEKQDQKGSGRIVAVARGTVPETCPVRALNSWLEVRGRDPGALFTYEFRGKATRMYADKVNRIVKAAVESAGLDRREHGAHSLRASFVTAAFASGCGEILIARHTGHRSLSSLRRYFRPADPWTANPSAMIGL